MVHSYSSDIGKIRLPECFTYPFCYQPHPLCVMAAEEVQAYLESCTELKAELRQGKMFGVLAVRDSDGNIGFLAAFSGLLEGSREGYFVPPVYDLSAPEGFFKVEEEQITLLNHRISEMERGEGCQQSRKRLEELRREAEKALADAKAQLTEAKKQRDRRRREEKLTEADENAFIRESQYQKAEFKRLGKRWEERIDEEKARLEAWQIPIEKLKEERKLRSAALQQRLFEHFRMLNAKGEERDLCDIFRHTPQGVPPAGAGECAAPKLLQYAYRNRLKPLAMAEFWWGGSPKSEVRIQGNYYPACQHKCGPILAHMLQGLEVEPNPLAQENGVVGDIRTVYEDEWLLVVDKPSGMLSVPGKEALPSVYGYIKDNYPEATGPLLVHRLDMDTSGLLLVAKRKDIHEKLQRQFEGREVRKRYIALLDGAWPVGFPRTGFVKLPLRPDYENRPCQLVDTENGKPAVTRYEVLGEEQKPVDGNLHVLTRVAYYPQTGRTHQLRVHSAHPQGVNLPIWGDRIYGKPADRLYLHAERLELRHPVTGKWMKWEVLSPF